MMEIISSYLLHSIEEYFFSSFICLYAVLTWTKFFRLQLMDVSIFDVSK